MAFSRRDYVDEIGRGIQALDSQVNVYCLRAGMATILKRLEGRGMRIEGEEWIVRKAQACVDAHHDPHFGEPINTEGFSAAEVAQQILERLGHQR